MLSLILAAIVFPLEWGTASSPDAKYEVELDPQKLGASHFVVRADGRPVSTETFAGKAPGSLRLRFQVPQGAKALDCVGDDIPSSCAKTAADNIFAAAVGDVSGWKLKNVSVECAADGGLVFSSDAKGTACYTVSVPKGLAGSDVQFEIEVENVGGMCWPNNIVVWQLDADENTLAEPLVDPRWSSHIRPVGRRTLICEAGRAHPEVAKLRLELSLSASQAKYDLYGYPISEAADRIAKLKVTRVAVRQGTLLPFPKYRDDFFAAGVSGREGDCSLRLGGDRHQTMVWYQTRSVASWANIRSFAGDDAQMRDERLVFFPAAVGTVEVWLKPDWKASEDREVVIFEGAQHSLCQYKGVYQEEQGRVFAVTYNPSTRTARMMKKDVRGVVFEGAGTVDIPPGSWSHLAAVFEPGREGALFVNGKRALRVDMNGYEPVDLKTAPRPNDKDVPELYLGSDFKSARCGDAPFGVVRSPCFEGLVDNWRISTGVRYQEDFVPQREFSVDADTRAFFSFDRSYSGVSGGGLGWIPLTIQSSEDRVDHRLVTDRGVLQYWAKEIQPQADPRQQLEVVNYRKLPTVEDFTLARRVKERTADLAIGDTLEITVPDPVFTDFVEIANTGTKALRHPLLLNRGELDPRSFGDLRDSLLARRRTDRETVNDIFQYALRTSDYFMMHTAFFPYDGGDEPNDVWREGLGMLNSYCGFECGPLNTVVVNLFPCVGGLPASMTQGYKHSFEQVFFDGKNHVYDLSAQKFFPAMDNETAACLAEMDDQPGLKRRHFGSVDHFIRNATRPAGADHPIYQRKVAMTLKPGECFRVWFDNNGEVNDLMSSPKIDRRAAKEKPGVLVDYSERTHAKKHKIWRVNRFFPQSASGFLRWSGVPSSSRGVFTDNGTSFDYEVESCYPVVAAEYAAVCRNGSKVPIEISTDRGGTFRPLADGLRRYEVRARYRYTIRVMSPLADVTSFSAMTQVQINSRIFPGRLQAGENVLTLKGTGEGAARVTIGWRENARRLEVRGALCSGTIPGAETSLVVIDPKSGASSFDVVGGSAKLGVKATDGIKARLENGRLVLSAQGEPRIGYVKLLDQDLERTLTVLVCDGARLVRPSDFSRLDGPILTKAGAEMVQDALVYRNSSDLAEATFAPIAAGEYMVLALERFEALREDSIRSPHFKMSVGGLKDVRFGFPANHSCDYYKAMYGCAGGRANWKWDYLVDRRVSYPLTPIGVFRLAEANRLTVSAGGSRNQPLGDTELGAILLVPDAGEDFRCEVVKVLCGLNTQAWKVK